MIMSEDWKAAPLRDLEQDAAKCRWTQDAEDGSWDTDCGNKFCIEAGTPEENGMLFCCYCGAALVTPNGKSDRLAEDNERKET